MHRRRDGIVAKNKVINTVLTLKDEMSGGLVAAAKAAKIGQPTTSPTPFST